MPTVEHNASAWNRLSGPECPWSRPVTREQIDEARNGRLAISLAGEPIPLSWLGEVREASILCLASGGGQQAPLLAAAGAQVSLVDLSQAQLQVDREVCAAHNLTMRIEQGSMTDLSMFDSASFDLVLNPVSTCYIPDVHPVWRECARVLRPGGHLISGAINPMNFMFEENDGSDERGLEVKYALPFVESETLSPEVLASSIDREMVFTWSHTFEDLIQGQIACGFVICGLLESRRTDARAPALNNYAPTYMTTRAMKQTNQAEVC